MDQKKTGRFLKELRREKGLTQEQLAERFGVTNRSVSRWENGVNMPDLDVMISRRLCGVFLAAIAAFCVYGYLDIRGLASTGIYENIADFSLGLVFGVLLLGALFTSRYGAKVQAAKRRILHKSPDCYTHGR